jgi:hypothetical protein
MNGMFIVTIDAVARFCYRRRRPLAWPPDTTVSIRNRQLRQLLVAAAVRTTGRKEGDLSPTPSPIHSFRVGRSPSRCRRKAESPAVQSTPKRQQYLAPARRKRVGARRPLLTPLENDVVDKKTTARIGRVGEKGTSGRGTKTSSVAGRDGGQ